MKRKLVEMIGLAYVSVPLRCPGTNSSEAKVDMCQCSKCALEFSRKGANADRRSQGGTDTPSGLSARATSKIISRGRVPYFSQALTGKSRKPIRSRRSERLMNRHGRPLHTGKHGIQPETEIKTFRSLTAITQRGPCPQS
jgi:hypothetical protein